MRVTRSKMVDCRRWRPHFCIIYKKIFLYARHGPLPHGTAPVRVTTIFVPLGRFYKEASKVLYFAPGP
jgi:hypothetical protein